MDRQKKSIKNLKALKTKQKMEVMYQCIIFVFRLKPQSNLCEYSTVGTVPVSWMECISAILSDHNGNEWQQVQKSNEQNNSACIHTVWVTG